MEGTSHVIQTLDSLYAAHEKLAHQYHRAAGLKLNGLDTEALVNSNPTKLTPRSLISPRRMIQQSRIILSQKQKNNSPFSPKKLAFHQLFWFDYFIAEALNRSTT